MFSSTALVLLATLASQVSAGIFVTEPVASTQCSATLPCNVKWNDDGVAPALAAIGPCRIELCVGGQFQQTCLQNISPSTDVSKIAQVTFNPDPAVGQTGPFYFVKFISLAFMDPAAPTVPYTQYSAKFTIGGMMAQWNQTIQDQISSGSNTGAASSAPLVSTPATTSRPGTTAIASRISASVKPSTSTAPAKSSSAALPLAMPGVFTSVAAVTVGVTLMSVVVGALALGL